MLELKAAFRQDLLDTLSEHKNLMVESEQMPLDPKPYTPWKVLDPITKTLTCLRIYMPFSEVLAGIEDFDSSIIKSMPDKFTWFTFMIDKNASFYESFIPEFDSDFVPNSDHVNQLLDLVSNPVECGYGRGYYGWGEAGIGKTSTALWLMSVLRTAVVHMNCKNNMESEEFFLIQAAIDGKWTQVHGPLLFAVEHNWPIIIDELDLGPSEFWPSINNLIEGRKYAVPGMQNKQIKAGSNFRLIAFGNTGPSGSEIGAFAGRSQIDSSFFDRMNKDYYEQLTERQFKSILCKKFKGKIEVDLISKIAKFAIGINKCAKSGSINEMLSPRSLIALCKQYLQNKDYVNCPLLYAIGNVLGSTLDSKETLESVLNVYSANICDSSLDINTVNTQWKDRAKKKTQKVITTADTVTTDLEAA